MDRKHKTAQVLLSGLVFIQACLLLSNGYLFSVQLCSELVE